MATTNTTPERCLVCDAVLATEADHAEWKGRTGPTFTAERLYSLCWSRIDGPCLRTPVNWRDRALAAEAACKAIDRQRTNAEAMVLVLETDVHALGRHVLAAKAALQSAGTLGAIRTSLARMADEADILCALAGPCLREACRAIDRARAGGFPP